MVDNSVQGRLIELAHVAESCRITFLDISRDSHWRPARGSIAAVVQAVLKQHDPALSTADLSAGFDLVSEVVVTYLEVAAGHFGGLAALYRNGEAMFPPAPVVRSIMELCAHSMWVLGDRSGTPADMLARAYLEEFASCEFAKMATGWMHSKDDQTYKRALLRWATVRNRAIAAFPGTTRRDLSEERPGRTIAGQVLLGPKGSVTWMFDFVHKAAGGTVDEDQARGVYAFLSSGTHPSLYPARQLRVAVDHGDHYGTVLSMPVAHLERILATAVLVFYNALSYVLDFYGLDRAVHDALTATIDEFLPGRLT